jgi:GNAT superfamily N-acetyltransferase
VGFLALKQHFPLAAEIHVMAVHPEQHRKGIGRALVQAAEVHLKDKGSLFLQVKTLGISHPDAGYQKTRKFYLAMGFIPLGSSRYKSRREEAILKPQAQSEDKRWN